MSFVSDVVSIEWNRNNLIMRRGSSALLIEAEKVQNLRTLKSKAEFTEFFLTQALVNREARRVFQSWERKDKDLMGKLFTEVTA